MLKVFGQFNRIGTTPLTSTVGGGVGDPNGAGVELATTTAPDGVSSSPPMANWMRNTTNDMQRQMHPQAIRSPSSGMVGDVPLR